MMSVASWSEWVCFAVTLVFVLFSHEVGFRFGTRRRLKPGENPEASAGTLSGTTIGLLAFMLAFTFNGAATNHHARKDLIIDEANAVRAAYQRAMALPAPYRAEINGLLREYVDIRVKAPGLRPAERKLALGRSMAIQGELWALALVLQQKQPDVPMVGPFMESLREVFDLHVRRVEAAFQSRIPSIIWTVLYLLTFITMAMVGYRIGLTGIRSTFTELSMALAFSAVLLVIAALDRPDGIMRVSQKPLADLLVMFRAGGQ